MRASRLLSILLLLQNRGQLSAQELAAELEVSVRTIYRDIDALSAAGVPVYATRGPAGGFALTAGYRTRLTGLTADEAEALFLAGMPGPAAELGLGTVLATSQLKLMAALPPRLRERAMTVHARFHLDAPGWGNSIESAPYLKPLADAIWINQVVRIRYRRWRGEVDRRLEPLGLVLKSGIWYLVARADGDLRTYRVSRIITLEPTSESFTRPVDFDLPVLWEAWIAGAYDRIYPVHATVRLSPDAQRMLPHLIDRHRAHAALASAGPPDAHGWRTATLAVEAVSFAATELLRFGTGIEVISPPELRTALAANAAAIAARYEASD